MPSLGSVSFLNCSRTTGFFFFLHLFEILLTGLLGRDITPFLLGWLPSYNIKGRMLDLGQTALEISCFETVVRSTA